MGHVITFERILQVHATDMPPKLVSDHLDDGQRSGLTVLYDITALSAASCLLKPQ